MGKPTTTLDEGDTKPGGFLQRALKELNLRRVSSEPAPSPCEILSQLLSHNIATVGVLELRDSVASLETTSALGAAAAAAVSCPRGSAGFLGRLILWGSESRCVLFSRFGILLVNAAGQGLKVCG